ncbi:MAG: glycosyltransferase family 2 protein [Pseudomonadota bacterium]
MAKFSIVITTTRPRLLPCAIRSALAQSFQDFEVVVSDNSDEGCEALVRGFADPRVRYVRPSEYLTLIDHWNFAFAHAGGEAHVLLCEDDAIAPNLLSILDRELSDHADIDTVSWTHAGYMEGPGQRNGGAIRFGYNAFSGQRFVYEASELLAEMFASGTGKAGAVKRKLPLFPFAVYRRELIARIRERLDGALFLPIDPMTSAAAAALAFSHKHLRLDLPLTVLGAPPDSSGGHVADPRTFTRMTAGMRIERAPIKLMSVFPSDGADTILRLQAAMPERLGSYRLDLANYFLACWRGIREMQGMGRDVAAEMAAWHAALGEAPAEIQAAVAAGVAAGTPARGALRSAARAINRALDGAPRRLVDALHFRFRRPSDRLWVEAQKLGLQDIFDCAQYLGRVTQRFA